jgi:thimet oligopeptidase
MVEEKFYNLDQEQLRPYFPFEAVTKGMLGIYEQILGLSFTHIENAEKWHDDVEMVCKR